MSKVLALLFCLLSLSLAAILRKPLIEPQPRCRTFAKVDVCFVLDTTGSMAGQIAQMQDIIEEIVNDISDQYDCLQVRFATVGYKDHGDASGTYLTLKTNFTTNKDLAIDFVNHLTATGGGNRQEAVHNALHEAATQLNWAPDAQTFKRFIFHITDAAGHGSQFNDGSTAGCTCGLQLSTVVNAINAKDICYRLLKIRTYPKLDLMGTVLDSQIDCSTIYNYPDDFENFGSERIASGGSSGSSGSGSGLRAPALREVIAGDVQATLQKAQIVQAAQIAEIRWIPPSPAAVSAAQIAQIRWIPPSPAAVSAPSPAVLASAAAAKVEIKGRY